MVLRLREFDSGEGNTLGYNNQFTLTFNNMNNRYELVNNASGGVAGSFDANEKDKAISFIDPTYNPTVYNNYGFYNAPEMEQLGNMLPEGTDSSLYEMSSPENVTPTTYEPPETISRYEWTLPTGNTISTSGTNPDEALAEAQKEFTRIKTNFGGFEGVSLEDAFSSEPKVNLAGVETYINDNKTIPVGTPMGGQNVRRNTATLERAGYTVEDGVVTGVPYTVEEDTSVADAEAEATRVAEEQRLAAEAEATRLAEEQRIAAEAEAARLAEEQRLAAEAEASSLEATETKTTTPQGTSYKPSQATYTPTQQQSSTYTPAPYNPSAPTVTQAAQVAPATTDFGSQYVAGPVQQTIQLPSSTGSVGGTQTVMYRNQRGQQIPVTEQDGKPMTYVPPGYTRMSTPQPFNQGGAVGYAEGGDTSLDAEYNLATKFLGYKGPKSRPALNDFMKASPGAAARMGMYQQAMRGMYKGGVVYANDGTDVGLTDGGVADGSISGEGDQYYDETLPMFFDAVSQTMQPMQSTYSTIAPDSSQFISSDAGQVGTYAPTVGAAQVGTTSQATTPTYTPSATYGATGTADQVRDETGRLQPVTGQVSDQAQVDAAQGTSSLNIDAAQGTATMMTNPVTREIQEGELISGAADAQKAAKFTEQIQAAQATPSKQATVQGQLEGLMQQFEGGDTPAWAAGAMRNALGAMAARGLGASSLAGQAAVQAAMESALPIASADAQTIASFEAQNLSNRQQRAMLGAQQRAQFMGQEFDQAFQARVQNSSRIADIANMNFTAEQQVALENSRAANTMNLANLSNRQAGVMAEAAAIANMDMANLNNRQQAAVQNAQNFMAMDMSNLDKAQQTALFRSQQNIQALFTDQAAENAALQFNASSENQTKQFFASLSSQTSQFNAAQTNAVNQFNVNSVNAINEFNANLQQQRDTFNATNGLVVSQANAQWRQNLATLNTAAANDSNMAFAAAINGMTSKNIDSIWQRERDLMSYNITSIESGKDRAMQILLGEQTLTALKEKIGYAEDSAESEFFMRFLFGDFKDLFK